MLMPGDLHYFSLLRPFSEYSIAKKFAKLTAYHGTFISCNRAYQLSPSGRLSAWCGDCPKCRFVFLILAPFLDPEPLIAIFGKNLLDDPLAIPAFDLLREQGGPKPFECVGEQEEIQLAIDQLALRAAWRDTAVISALTASGHEAGAPSQVVERSEAHIVPGAFARALDEIG